MKYYVVSDVHGFYDQTVRALAEKGYFDDPLPHKLIICGDLFDRGPQSREMQQFVAELVKKDAVILIRGNHEDLMEELVEKLPELTETDLYHSHYNANKTVHTLRDLTGCTVTKMIISPEQVATRMRNTDFYKRILPAMRNYYETERYIFVHGWIPSVTSGPVGNFDSYKYMPGWRHADEAAWYRSRWYNGMLAAHQGVTEPGKTIVCGHWHACFGHSRYEGKSGEDCSPYYAEGIIAIDGYTAYSRQVNCIVLEDEDLAANR